MVINLLSPIAKIPFGRERGIVIWQLDINSFSWLRKQQLTNCARETLDFAWDMFMHEGQYAILRRDTHILGRVTLVMICPDFSSATLKCAGGNDFVYHIVKQKVVSYEKAS